MSVCSKRYFEKFTARYTHTHTQGRGWTSVNVEDISRKAYFRDFLLLCPELRLSNRYPRRNARLKKCTRNYPGNAKNELRYSTGRLRNRLSEQSKFGWAIETNGT